MKTTQTVGEWMDGLAVANPGWCFGAETLRTYVRIWKRLDTQESRHAVAFVERATGRVHRADSWKKAGRTLDVVLSVVVA